MTSLRERNNIKERKRTSRQKHIVHRRKAKKTTQIRVARHKEENPTICKKNTGAT